MHSSTGATVGIVMTIMAGVVGTAALPAHQSAVAGSADAAARPVMLESDEGESRTRRIHTDSSSPASVTLLLMCSTRTAWAQLEPSCVENSPERRGEIGCSLVENKPLPPGLKAPLVWHIDQFKTETEAKAAVGPNSVAFAAHGAAWLMTIESTASDHHGGRHVAAPALPPLPAAERYAMLAMSAYIPAGLTSRFHHHSGVEGFFVADGQQCLETPDQTYVMNKGDTLVVPPGIPMRLVATGSTPRRALAVIVYDASQPPTTRMEGAAEPNLMSCK
jgi:quercetin dioxygenase-like cupin family protein